MTWGCATASYQIEGSKKAPGRGLCVWDMQCWSEDRVAHGNTGDVACNHIENLESDLDLMQKIGLSVSWPFIQPTGTGTVNPAGLDFYDRLIDGLLTRNIEPWLTVFHWDYPYDLFCRGGWLNRESVQWFADYAGILAERYGDRVKHWMTLNEPQCFVGLGHRDGNHAPGLKMSWRETLLVGHHTLMAHGAAVQALRAHATQEVSIGWAPVGGGVVPLDEFPASIEAARHATFNRTYKDYWNMAWWIDPVVKGCYPEASYALFGADAPQPQAGDMELIRQPIDYLGLNVYQSQKGNAEGLEPYPQGIAETSMDWPVTPAALRWVPRFAYERYGLPIVITENGLANNDWVMTDGKVHDPQRIDFLTRYLRELAQAVTDGVELQAYFQWSFMDNFEWALGYAKRFGLVHVDYQTQQRTLKDSAEWYRSLIESNGSIIQK
jgi:beta-glucosidase